MCEWDGIPKKPDRASSSSLYPTKFELLKEPVHKNSIAYTQYLKIHVIFMHV